MLRLRWGVLLNAQVRMELCHLGATILMVKMGECTDRCTTGSPQCDWTQVYLGHTPGHPMSVVSNLVGPSMTTQTNKHRIFTPFVASYLKCECLSTLPWLAVNIPCTAQQGHAHNLLLRLAEHMTVSYQGLHSHDVTAPVVVLEVEVIKIFKFHRPGVV